MPRAAGIVSENSFINGFVTQATGLNFPENAVTEAYDCEFNLDGSVRRRLGFDLEDAYATKTINRSNKAVVTYLWKNVSGNGDLSLQVVQVGPTVYFYRTTNATFSVGAVSTTVTLTGVAGAPAPDAIEAQFSDGNGLLFITHPYCEPMMVSYNVSTDVATATNITLKIRDFEGATADPYLVDERPTSTLAALNVSHKYNLYNQGWRTTELTAWDTAQTTMPSDADVMWRFKDSSNNFDASTASINRITAGNTPAPHGHFVLSLANQDRDTASGLSGVAATTTSFYRPSTSAFFAGRLFYAGINYTGFNNSIYFSQIVERNEQYGFCHQVNDPTAEDLFDLLPSDGGSITIPEAGTIHKLFAMIGGLVVFAANGVWFVTGSSGIGFTAADYSVQKLANITTLTASSFVNVAGLPAWWNSAGIHMVQMDNTGNQNNNFPMVQSITLPKIKDFYDAIPLSSKRFAKGIYHFTDLHIRWVYRSEGTDQVTNQYEYDRVLNYNLQTGAFFVWKISPSPVKVNSIIISDITSGAVSVNNVTANAGVDLVIDGSGNQVISFSTSGLETSPFDKYLVSYPDSGSYKFTFADKINANYLDWFQYDLIGVDFESYFISGYKLAGNAIKKFQSTWVQVYSKLDNNPTSYYFQGIWDFANTGAGTGKWSARQYVNHINTDFSNATKRLKVRGHGKTLQYRVQSVTGQPFHIIGWSTYGTSNATP